MVMFKSLISFLFIRAITGSCATQENMDACVKSYTSSIQTSCYTNNSQNYECLCEQLPALAGCYDNCPTDVTAMGRKQSTLAEKAAYCQAASQVKMGGGTIPSASPTLQGLFAVNSQGTMLTINAGPTQIIAPIRGGETNTNTPVIGSLYNSYTLGSATIGFKSASSSSLIFSRSSQAAITHPSLAFIMACYMALMSL